LTIKRDNNWGCTTFAAKAIYPGIRLILWCIAGLGRDFCHATKGRVEMGQIVATAVR